MVSYKNTKSSVRHHDSTPSPLGDDSLQNLFLQPGCVTFRLGHGTSAKAPFLSPKACCPERATDGLRASIMLMRLIIVIYFGKVNSPVEFSLHFLDKFSEIKKHLHIFVQMFEIFRCSFEFKSQVFFLR